MSTPRRPAEQKAKAIELKFNSSASDTQTITSIPLPQHKQINGIHVLKDGRIAILEHDNLAIYSDATAFERPPVISIRLPYEYFHHFGRMVELSENQIIYYYSISKNDNSNCALLCDLSNKRVKVLTFLGPPRSISALNDTQFIVRMENINSPFLHQEYLSLCRLDANNLDTSNLVWCQETSRLDLLRHNNNVDRNRLSCLIPATTTVIIEDRNNLGHFNVFKQVDKKGWDNNEETTLIPNYPVMDINPLSQYAITSNSNGELLLSFCSPYNDGESLKHTFCIINSAFQSSRHFYVNEFKGKGVNLRVVKDFIFLPDAKTMVASAIANNPDTKETTHYLLTLNIDHGYSFVKMPRSIKDLSLLPSGEILVAGPDAFFSTFDSKYMKDYRAQIAQHAAGVTQLPSALGNIVQSYLFHPSIHSREQRVDRTMQPDDPLSEADTNPTSPEVKLAPQSNARRIDEFVKNASAYIKKNQSSSLFHDANSPKNIAETTFLRGLISRFNSSESKSINIACYLC